MCITRSQSGLNISVCFMFVNSILQSFDTIPTAKSHIFNCSSYKSILLPGFFMIYKVLLISTVSLLGLTQLHTNVLFSRFPLWSSQLSWLYCVSSQQAITYFMLSLMQCTLWYWNSDLFCKNKFISELDKKVRKEVSVMQWLKHAKRMVRIRLLTRELDLNFEGKDLWDEPQ